MRSIKERTQNLIHHFKLSTSGQIHGKDSYHLDYEGGVCRQDELSKLIRDTVIFFALSSKELESLDSDSLAKLQKRAWGRISDRKSSMKGDYGELLLFLILEVYYPAKKFVTKARLRSSKGDEIKGYDCAHFSIEDDGEICLWLGEAKFHQSFSSAITKATESINKHLTIKSIKDELSILEGNIDIQGEEAEKLEDFLNSGKSIDKIKFKIPILLTYDSSVVQSNSSICEKFSDELTEELNSHYLNIEGKKFTNPENFELHFILLPLKQVKEIKDFLEIIEKTHK
ncbi:DUF1837 domain-containing protein [Flagellimonas marinaquae]|uniref:HamA C-terminal domain-containing protein n=1 Tax=Flagellimonas marinaquae TaxID=254955 RepID=UPI00207621FC|nr:DUF1837 domain-containing protein [Allomuricauda aquimarina]USD25100.1 DUF1837 domain-containing protein [Allomuricauda aquimarina]